MRSDTRHVLFRGGSPPSLPQPLPLYSTYGVLRLDRCTLDEARVAEGLEGVVAEELLPELVLDVLHRERADFRGARGAGERDVLGRVEVRARRRLARGQGQRRVVEVALDAREQRGPLARGLVGEGQRVVVQQAVDVFPLGVGEAGRGDEGFDGERFVCCFVGR